MGSFGETKVEDEVEVEATARAGAQPVAMNNVNAVKNVNRSLSLGVRPTRGAAGRLNGVRTHVNKSLVSSSARPSLKKAVGSRGRVARRGSRVSGQRDIPHGWSSLRNHTCGSCFRI